MSIDSIRYKTYNNVIEAKKSLYQNAIIPELNKVRDELNRWLAPAYGEKIYIDFDYTNISELQEEMDKVVNQMNSAWWLTPNEKRQAMSYSIDADNEKLNDFYIPANLMPLEDDIIEDDFKSLETNFSELYDVKLNDIKDDKKEEVEEKRAATEVGPDKYTTIREAEDRAKELGGSGHHIHRYQGEVYYMPFKTHEEWLRRTGKKKDWSI